MTECNTTSVDFTPLGRRQVVADFLGGRLTTDAGALLLREVDRRIGLLDSLDKAIPDPRDRPLHGPSPADDVGATLHFSNHRNTSRSLGLPTAEG